MLGMAYNNWQEFKEVAVRRGPKLIHATINPRGIIAFDSDAFRLMGEPEAVCLMFEPNRKLIGIKPLHSDQPHAVMVHMRHVSQRVVRSLTFLRKHGITVTETIEFRYPYIENGALILDLRTAVRCPRAIWMRKARRKG